MSANVSVVLITYNQEAYVEEAFAAILGQDFSHMEVIVSDDHSTDATWEIIKALAARYQGPHRIVLNRNPHNLGINRHINAACRMATGDFIVIAAGDDVSLPSRVALSVRAWRAGASGVFSNAMIFDRTGTGSERLLARETYEGIGDWQGMIIHGYHGCWGCTLSWEKRVSEIFGDIPETPLGEDAFIPFRCALLNGLTYLPQPLVRYRDHGGNISFWAREKTASGPELIRLGTEILKFEVAMHRSWLKDLRVASEHGLLTIEEEAWAIRTLSQHMEMARNTTVLFLVNFLWLPFMLLCHAVPRLTRQRRSSVRKMLVLLMHYRFPRTYDALQKMLGKNV